MEVTSLQTPPAAQREMFPTSNDVGERSSGLFSADAVKADSIVLHRKTFRTMSVHREQSTASLVEKQYATETTTTRRRILTFTAPIFRGKL